jgi:hypothetical protein
LNAFLRDSFSIVEGQHHLFSKTFVEDIPFVIFIFLSWFMVYLSIYYVVNRTTIPFSLFDSVPIVNLILTWLPLLQSFMGITIIALIFHCLYFHLSVVKVYLLEGGMPICGIFIDKDDRFIRISNDAGELIEINKDAIKIMVRSNG